VEPVNPLKSFSLADAATFATLFGSSSMTPRYYSPTIQPRSSVLAKDPEPGSMSREEHALSIHKLSRNAKYIFVLWNSSCVSHGSFNFFPSNTETLWNFMTITVMNLPNASIVYKIFLFGDPAFVRVSMAKISPDSREKKARTPRERERERERENQTRDETDRIRER